MVVTAYNEIGIIDFSRCDFGDPWEEFNGIVWRIKQKDIKESRNEYKKYCKGSYYQ